LEVGECSDRLVVVGAGVGPIHLVEVDPVGLEPLQAVLDLLHDPAPRVAAIVRVAGLTHRYVHRAVEFRCQDDVVTTTARQRFADDDLGLSLGVDVGGVDEVDAVVECPVDDRHRRVAVAFTEPAEHHGAETQGAHARSGVAEDAMFHGGTVPKCHIRPGTV